MKQVVYEVCVVDKRKDCGIIGSCELPSRDGICCFDFGIAEFRVVSNARLHVLY